MILMTQLAIKIGVSPLVDRAWSKKVVIVDSFCRLSTCDIKVGSKLYVYIYSMDPKHSGTSAQLKAI